MDETVLSWLAASAASIVCRPASRRPSPTGAFSTIRLQSSSNCDALPLARYTAGVGATSVTKNCRAADSRSTCERVAPPTK